MQFFPCSPYFLPSPFYLHLLISLLPSLLFPPLHSHQKVISARKKKSRTGWSCLMLGGYLLELCVLWTCFLWNLRILWDTSRASHLIQYLKLSPFISQYNPNEIKLSLHKANKSKHKMCYLPTSGPSETMKHFLCTVIPCFHAEFQLWLLLFIYTYIQPSHRCVIDWEDGVLPWSLFDSSPHMSALIKLYKWAH